MLSTRPYHSFPRTFLWGVAAAAYQIEGGATEGGRGPSIWDTFCDRLGAIRNGDSGAVACDHYHRYESDLDLMASLNVTNYRFSVAWPRIYPEGTGEPNREGIAFYDRLIDAMLERGIQPSATCYHWDLPQALEDRGGWRNRDTARAFAEYAGTLAHHFGDRVKMWYTLNEPWCSWWLGHKDGIHAPGARESGKVLRQVAHNLLLAHGGGTQALRANTIAPDLKIGIVHNSNNLIPFTESVEDVDATRRIWEERNGWLLGPVLRGEYPAGELAALGADAPDIEPGDMELINQPTDFLGLNVYFSNEVVRASEDPQFLEAYYPRTDFQWPITPEAVYWSLRFANETYGPISLYVTENGCCYPDQVNAQGRVEDFARLAFIRENLKCVHRASKEGIPVKGYFLWSILDNFEWAEGYAKRFGIVHVNFNTQKRTPKASALWYARTMQLNGF
ncbi:MAG: GH1 family beta-glucosidase [Candidatus Sumerlaeia bacterium]|nr:GH1 family beta-glucosidase [Candidatus Sumerlaeia bacterium]